MCQRSLILCGKTVQDALRCGFRPKDVHNENLMWLAPHGIILVGTRARITVVHALVTFI